MIGVVKLFSHYSYLPFSNSFYNTIIVSEIMEVFKSDVHFSRNMKKNELW